MSVVVIIAPSAIPNSAAPLEWKVELARLAAGRVRNGRGALAPSPRARLTNGLGRLSTVDRRTDESARLDAWIKEPTRADTTAKPTKNPVITKTGLDTLRYICSDRFGSDILAPSEPPPRSGPAGPPGPVARPVRRWPVVRLAGAIGAAYGAVTVLARWAVGHAPPPADGVAYQIGRVIGGMIFWGVIGLVVDLVICVMIGSGRDHRAR